MIRTKRKKQWVLQYVDTLEWVLISNKDNKRFSCPQCVKEPA